MVFFMIRRILLLACICGPALAGPAAVTHLEELQGQMARTLAPADTGGTLWGVKVSSLRTGRTWFETNAAARMVPASNTKLFTGAMALERLGAERRLVTSLRVTNAPDASGQLNGPLRIVGGGDPTLCDRLHGASWERTWAPLIEAVRRAGIRRVEGDLLCDEGRFTGPPYGSGWNWDDLAEGYGAAVSALTAGDNLVSVVVTPGLTVGAAAAVRLDPLPDVLSLEVAARTVAKGSGSDLSLFRLPGDSRLRVAGTIPLGAPAVTLEASVPSPALWFGMLFRDALLKAGIPVTGSLRVLGSRDPTPPGLARAPWKEIAAVPSPTVGELVREMMKPSQNLYAQLLWLTVGVESGSGVQKGVAGVPLETTEEAGARALEGVLSAAGIASTEVRLEEGSGLSRKNLITPQATVRLLNYMARHRYADAWKASLPVGGVDGTLRQRFTQPGLKGNVRAKTGSLRNVTALSGYLTNSVGEPLAFSIIANNAVPVGGSLSAREQTDALVEQVARSAVREE